MKEIPNRLQCSYCIRNRTHGGECSSQRSSYDEKGCLVFKVDEKGCIRNGDLKIPIPLYHDVPVLNIWCDDWQYKGVETEIRINRINCLRWNTKQGTLIIYCNCDYYVNEYHEDYVEKIEKPNLRII